MYENNSQNLSSCFLAFRVCHLHPSFLLTKKKKSHNKKRRDFSQDVVKVDAYSSFLTLLAGVFFVDF